MIVRRREYYLCAVISQFIQHTEAIETRHFDIEEDDVRFMMTDQQQGFCRLLYHRNDLQLRAEFANLLFEIFEAAAFVIDEDRLYRFHASVFLDDRYQTAFITTLTLVPAACPCESRRSVMVTLPSLRC